MNIVMLSPGFPLDQAYFTRALAATGARVIGVGDQPVHALPAEARDSLSHYEHVSLGDEGAVVRALEGLARNVRIDKIECLWEPYVVLAATIRERLDLPGMRVDQAMPFRDKELMKRALDDAGIRTPRHAAVTTVAQAWEAAERIGYPLIVKPIAGAGSADTYRIDSAQDLARVLPMIRHVDVVSVEEFIDGEEFTHDTVCAGGRILHENIGWYRPRPLEQRSHEWVSPMTFSLRDTGADRVAAGRDLGRAVLDALGFTDGFTHLEWYRKSDGEVVFGEIGARPPGARTVDVMNYAVDGDLFRMWAESTVHGRSEPLPHRYNAVSIFKRAQGMGRISRIDGLGGLVAEFGEYLCAVDLLPIGAPRRDWRATLLSDGMVIARHPELSSLVEIAGRFATDLRLYAE